jgi:hypothetical protein
MTLATAPPSLAVEPKAISISQYQALSSDIEIAKQQAVESFNYADPKGDKAARSYIAGLRKIRSRIESARKEAKSYALEYGRAVDAQAKALEAEILALIDPHQQALDDIAQRERERVAGHEESLRLISAMVQSAMIAGQSAAVIREAITSLQLCPTGGMEEFEQQANTEIDNALRILEALHTAAVEREKREALEAAEAQRLAEEESARRKAEDEAQVQARIKEADARARREVEERLSLEAEQFAAKEKEAEERVRQSEERAATAEAPRVRQQQEMEQAIRESAKEEQRRAAAQREAEAALRRAEVTRRNDLAAELGSALVGKTRVQVVEALLDGTLHPAVFIDWAKA